ncbi:MAG: 2-hydroxyacid dehydrogenase [Betaproteobacteria bacterium]|nr:2-hydroxyacid dehydrogenase [Betaproteobacteria bacterium]
MKQEVLVTGAFYGPSMEWLDREFTTHRLFEAKDRAKLLSDVGPRVRAIAGSGRSDQALIQSLPNLEIIANFGVGYDNVNAAAARARKVMVTNTPGVLNEAVADTTLSLILAIERRVVAADRYLRAGKWVANGNYPLTRHLGDLKVGILGLGRIGKDIAKRTLAFGMQVQYHSRTRQADVAFPYFPSVLELAKASNVLVCILPGGAGTRHIINEDVMKALGPTGTLVNVARGSVVDTEALIRCLKNGSLGAAAIDVYDKEPETPEALWPLENVVLTPHLGSATHSTRKKMGDLVVQNLLEHFAGRAVLTAVPECAGLRR